MSETVVNINNANPDENPEVKQMSFFQRVIGIVVSPTETMSNLAQKPRILFPFLIVALGFLLFYLIRYPLYVDYLRTTTENALAQQNQQMTPEQIEASIKFANIFGLAFTPIGAILGWLVITAVLFGIVKIFKGEGSFKHYMSVAGYAYVIVLLQLILSVVASFFSGELMLNTSLGIFVPGLKGSYIYGLLRSIDLFSIWYYIVIAVGIFTVSKFNKTKSYTIMSVIYFASILINAFSLKNV